MPSAYADEGTGRTPQGVLTARAGIVPQLTVPLLIGRDCPIAHQKRIRPHREAHQKQIVPHREGNQEQTDADALSRRDTCLGAGRYSPTTGGLIKRWRSVASRPLNLGPDGPEVSSWTEYTTVIHLPAKESTC